LRLEEVLALCDPISHPSLAHQAGQHPRVHSQATLGVVLACLGYPDQALAQSSAAIAEARALAHPPSVAASLSLGTIVLLLVGDNAAPDERIYQLVAVAADQGFAYWRAVGAIFGAELKLKNGDVAEGLPLLRNGLAAYGATGAEVWMPYFGAFMAGACEIAGQIEEALTQFNEALQIADRTGEHFFTAELHRQKGQLLLRQGHSGAAEELYRNALGIAREQEAKLWELRAAVSLARLRRDQGRRAEARDLLAPVYGWFTEGFDTPDLQEAKTLLKSL
jgi:predicted ATPase